MKAETISQQQQEQTLEDIVKSRWDEPGDRDYDDKYGEEGSKEKKEKKDSKKEKKEKKKEKKEKKNKDKDKDKEKKEEKKENLEDMESFLKELKQRKKSEVAGSTASWTYLWNSTCISGRDQLLLVLTSADCGVILHLLSWLLR